MAKASKLKARTNSCHPQSHMSDGMLGFHCMNNFQPDKRSMHRIVSHCFEIEAKRCKIQYMVHRMVYCMFMYVPTSIPYTSIQMTTSFISTARIISDTHIPMPLATSIIWIAILKTSFISDAWIISDREPVKIETGIMATTWIVAHHISM